MTAGSEPAGDPRGILHSRAAQAGFAVARHAPSAALAPFVDYLWSVEWDRRGEPPHVQRILPNPALHLSVEPDRSRVTGPARTVSTYPLTGRGRVIGLRFRPGAAARGRRRRCRRWPIRCCRLLR